MIYFFVRLLEVEIPEIKKGIISIRKILRVPGLLSKLIVESKERGIDPLGTCIGQGCWKNKNYFTLDLSRTIRYCTMVRDKRELLFNLLSPVKPVVSLSRRGNDWNYCSPKKSFASFDMRENVKEISEYLG